MSTINAVVSFRLDHKENFMNKIHLGVHCSLPLSRKIQSISVSVYDTIKDVTRTLSKMSHGAVGLVKILNKVYKKEG